MEDHRGYMKHWESKVLVCRASKDFCQLLFWPVTSKSVSVGVGKCDCFSDTYGLAPSLLA